MFLSLHVRFLFLLFLVAGFVSSARAEDELLCQLCYTRFRVHSHTREEHLFRHVYPSHPPVCMCQLGSQRTHFHEI